MKLFNAAILAGSGVSATKTAISGDNKIIEGKPLKKEWELSQVFNKTAQFYHENIYSLIHETCNAFLKTDFSVELKLTEVPKTYTNFLHVHALNESEDPIREEHGERIPAMFLESVQQDLFLIGVCTFTFFSFLRTIQAIYIPENQQFLHICNSIDWNWNECFDTKPLDLNQWHTIKLLQRKGIGVILYDSYPMEHIRKY